MEISGISYVYCTWDLPLNEPTRHCDIEWAKLWASFGKTRSLAITRPTRLPILQAVIRVHID